MMDLSWMTETDSSFLARELAKYEQYMEIKAIIAGTDNTMTITFEPRKWQHDM